MRKRVYLWIPYFHLKNGGVRYGTPQQTQKDAWREYGRIVHDKSIEWTRGLDPFLASGIAAVKPDELEGQQ